MNTRQAAIAIALGIIGLLATSITTQAAPIVWSDNFDSYTDGDLPGQGSWNQLVRTDNSSPFGSPMYVVANPYGAGKVVDLGVSNGGNINAHIFLPTSFASFADGDTHVLTFDIYRVAGSGIVVPSIMLGQNDTGFFIEPPLPNPYTLQGYSATKDLNLAISDGVTYYPSVSAGGFYDYNANLGGIISDSGLTLASGGWHTVTESITRNGGNVQISLNIDNGSPATFTKTYDTGYNYLQLYSSAGGHLYVDNMKAYVQPVPASGTLIIIQ